eukprot:scaffold39894_cov61-Phaeocystis_antarctica.AAC.5
MARERVVTHCSLRVAYRAVPAGLSCIRLELTQTLTSASVKRYSLVWPPLSVPQSRGSIYLYGLQHPPRHLDEGLERRAGGAAGVWSCTPITLPYPPPAVAPQHSRRRAPGQRSTRDPAFDDHRHRSVDHRALLGACDMHGREFVFPRDVDAAAAQIDRATRSRKARHVVDDPCVRLCVVVF